MTSHVDNGSVQSSAAPSVSAGSSNSNDKNTVLTDHSKPDSTQRQPETNFAAQAGGTNWDVASFATSLGDGKDSMKSVSGTQPSGSGITEQVPAGS